MLDHIPNIFHISEIEQEFKNRKQLGNWLLCKQRSKIIKKVRNSLYVYIEGSSLSNCSKFEIASRISKDSFVAYHSALEYYGLGNYRFNDVYVCSSTRFNYFEFENARFYYHKVNRNNYMQIVEYKHAKSLVRVISLERAIIDCIDNIGLAGGIEELLHALSDVEQIDEVKLIEMLVGYDSVFLYQKCGYILEHFKDDIGLSDNFFNVCCGKITNQVRYFLKGEYYNYSYSSKWKLIAPTNLLSLINGGF